MSLADAPVRVGLVGAGPWASLFTAPLLATGPACVLAGVWARRHDAAVALAGQHGAVAVERFDDLLERCEAVAFAVPPDVQADLASRAARAGRPVLLDKPIGIQLAQAERLADAVGAAGVVSQIVLTNRYLPSMRAFVDAAGAFGAIAGRAQFLGDGLAAGSTFATPWRREHGALLDLGPHVLDALDAALGPITDVHAAGDALGVVAMTCHHAGGAISQATLSATTPVEPSGLTVELLGPAGRLAFDSTTSAARRELRTAMATIAQEFATAVRTGTPHPLDVHRALHLQRHLDAAAHQLTRSSGV